MTFKVLNTYTTQAIVLEHDDTLKIHNIEFEDVYVD